MTPSGQRTRIAYLAPWVDLGGSDKGTIDWFRELDQERYAASLITTQPSLNRRLDEVVPFAEEVWPLPELMPGGDFPQFIREFVISRGIQVLHIMNSRLAFDMLPDIAAFPCPPVVVVQLHVEEHDRSGYVRYVTTRYGNLVDAFSVTSHHLAAAMADYDVPRNKLRVIHTGVDAEVEFSPDTVRPRLLPEGRFDVLYPGRLVDQKDPLLMVEVAARTVAQRDDAHFHVVGDGPLEPAVRAAVTAQGLDAHVTFQGPSTELGPWYRASDALLMTSVFEGVPYTIYEALAMGLPVVAPALAGNVELLDGVGGTLIEPRDDAQAYADALAALAGNDELRARTSAEGRDRVRTQFNLAQMSRAHEALYDELIERRQERGALPQAPRREPPYLVEPITLAPRATRDQPLVSVIVPCFNHGIYLPACLAAIQAQEYPEIEIIVVDDASTDPETRTTIEALDKAADVRVICREKNGGPSRARNMAIDVARGRFILPVDADNLLLPGAIAMLVEQLQTAGEQVGFVYPAVEYFGTRTDLFEPPDWDLHILRHGNYCDTCSLFDRGIFDAGIRFDAEIKLGHEDWDLFLRIAERGVEGIRSREPVIRYRKQGFTRADTVEYAEASFHDEIRRRHERLLADPRVKPRNSPGIAVVVLDPLDDARATSLARTLDRQTMQDFELTAVFDGDWPVDDPVHAIRRLPYELGLTRSDMVKAAFGDSNAPLVLLLTYAGLSALEDPAACEKLVRTVRPHRELAAIALADLGEDHRSLEPMRDVADPHDKISGLLLVRQHDESWPSGLRIRAGEELADIAKALVSAEAQVAWRHLPARAFDAEPAEAAWLEPRRRRPATTGDAYLDVVRAREGARLPGSDLRPPRRWKLDVAWLPPETWPLVRHRHVRTGRRTFTNDHAPPPGYAIEHDLGVVHRFAPPGTVRLEVEDAAIRAVARESDWPAPASRTSVLGHVDTAAFPLLVPLMVGTHRPTGQRLLVNGDNDPLVAECDIEGTVGYIEGFPIRPLVADPLQDPNFGLRGLVRHVDAGRRRHWYTVGEPGPDATRVGELGALAAVEQEGTGAAWLTHSGLLVTDRGPFVHERPSLETLLRWSAAPLRWRERELVPRTRSAARRATLTPLLARRRSVHAPPDAPPVGYLYREPGTGLIALYEGRHAATGDQLLSTNEFELSDFGYVDIRRLGYLRERAPVTGALGTSRVAVPWATHFGLKVRGA